ncbi:MAG: inositol monophosphatase family protein [Xanthobacteraceae bacterium]
MLHSAVLNVMIKAAHRAGRSLKRDLGEVENLQVSLKGPRNFVTAADRRAEEIVYEELAKARPDYGFLGEEGGAREGADKSHRWIVDPLDGTTNFLHGIPHFAVSIGLERDGAIVAGLVYNPANDDTFIAERGKGAYLNERRIRVAGRKRLAEAVVACGLPHYGRGDLVLARHEIAAALAAGSLLVREAGGFVTDLDGGDGIFTKGEVVAGNDTMHHELLRLLKEAHKDAGKDALKETAAP